jgi:hypothetical protein
VAQLAKKTSEEARQAGQEGGENGRRARMARWKQPTRTLFAQNFKRKVSNSVGFLAAAGSSWNGRNRGNFCRRYGRSTSATAARQ